ncbi:hypothetical protein OROMI_014155 [Orobanche minor]
MGLTGVDSGLSLTPAQWSSFRNSFPSIQEAIVKLESRLRRKNAVHPSNNLNHTPEGIARQSEADMTHSSVDCAVEKSLTEANIPNSTSIFRPVKTEQVESEPEITNPPAYSLAENHSIAEINQLATSDSEKIHTVVSISAPPFPNQSHLLDAFSVVRPELLIPDDGKQSEADISKSAPAFQLVPIQPVRLNGRNYHSWRHQIRFLLNQLNIAYVLAEPCPSISSNSEASRDEKVKVRAAIQRWTNDDYMCRHNILNSLSDHLFQLHSPKNYSARELWDDLRLAYDEDFGTKRSQINKYIHFEMVDGVSILDQAQELGKIADSIIASGTWVDESFHVGVIVSKLPHSWKEFRIRLMREDFLPLNMLMHRLQVEEESRRKETDFKKGLIEPRFDSRLGVRKQGSKRICYCCGQDGHISMNCPNRKFEGHEKINDKENGHPTPRKHKRNR